MRLDEIRNMPVVVEPSNNPLMPDQPTHESVLRAYNILDKVKDYLKRGMPRTIILELIREMEGVDQDVFVSE